MEDLITLSKDTSDRPNDLYLGLFIKKNTQEDSYHLGFIYFKKNYSLLNVIFQHTQPIRGFNYSQATWKYSGIPSAYLLGHFGWKNYYLHQYENTNEVREEHKDYHAIHWLGFMDRENAIPIINVLKLIDKRIDAGYGITYGKPTFDEVDGRFIKDPTLQGDSLTCAVFVLCILEQFEFHIVDRESWIINEDTEKWQDDVIEMIQQYPPFAKPDFLEIQKSNVGKFPRFRPDQVFGASCLFEEDSIKHEQACKAGAIVLKKLEDLSAV